MNGWGDMRQTNPPRALNERVHNTHETAISQITKEKLRRIYNLDKHDMESKKICTKHVAPNKEQLKQLKLIHELWSKWT